MSAYNGFSSSLNKFSGNAEFHGTFRENLGTYDIFLYYTDSKALLFTKPKPKTANITGAYDSVDEEAYTYDVNPSDDDNETDLLEENIESNDSVDEDAYAYDVNPSVVGL